MIVDNQTPKRILRQVLVIGLVIASLFTVSVSNAQDASSPLQPPTLLRWAPPELDNPTTINVRTSGNRTIKLDSNRDYILNMPDTPVTEALRLQGGRNIVLIGGEIDIPYQGSNPTRSSRTGIKIKDSTGTVHIEGVWIYGEDLSEGIQIDAPDAIVQIQNVRIEDIRARDQVNFTDNHPDLIQPYGNVVELRVDHFTGATDYQGFMLKADFNGSLGTVDISNANIIARPTARYLIWFSNVNNAGDVTFENVYLDLPSGRHGSLGNAVWPRERASYPNQAQVIDTSDGSGVTWPAEMRPRIHGYILEGTPPQGDYVRQDQVGIGYVPVGYSDGTVSEIPTPLPTEEPTEVVLDVPGGVSAQATSDTTIDLMWIDNVSTETTYEITRDGTLITPLPVDSAVYYDTGLDPDTDYCYRVRAVNNLTVSAWSADICTSTQPTEVPTEAPTEAPTDEPTEAPTEAPIDEPTEAPTDEPTDEPTPELTEIVLDAPGGVSAQATSDTTIDLIWVDNASDEIMYEIERDGTVITPLPANSTVYFDTGLNPETDYCYRVRAVNNLTVSAWSAEVCASTQPATAPTPEPDGNQAPSLQTPADQMSLAGVMISLQIEASDPDGDLLRFTARDLPDGLTIDPETAQITGTPTLSGERTVTVTAIDSEGLTAETSFSWIVTGGDGGAEAPPNTVIGLMLVNADTNEDLLMLSDGMQINLSALPTDNLNVRAQVSSGVESVRFSLNDNSNFRLENEAPYALAGDLSGDYRTWSPSEGNYTLVAIPYTSNNASGNEGNSMSVTFSVVRQSSGGGSQPITPLPTTPAPITPLPTTPSPTTPAPTTPSPTTPAPTTPSPTTPAPTQPPSRGGGNNGNGNANMAVTRFVLVNADTNRDIMTLTNGQSIALNNLPTRNLNIRVEVSGNSESLGVQVNGGRVHYEDQLPYAVFLDIEGNYNAWRPSAGTYTLTATPYSRWSGNGRAGRSQTIRFTFTGN
ncbi:MAG: putative Ig domain-containing protein [Anaerolineae bacterium]